MHSIKAASPTEIPLIQQIAQTTWPVAYAEILSKVQLDYMLDLIYQESALKQQMATGHLFYILWEDKTAVGFIDLEQLDEDNCKLHKIYLLPSCQGKGYGAQLLNFAQAKAKALHANSLILNVNRYNKALGFYERQGFNIDKTVDIAIGQGFYMNDYVMRKAL